jgi:hypothetical protein
MGGEAKRLGLPEEVTHWLESMGLIRGFGGHK